MATLLRASPSRQEKASGLLDAWASSPGLVYTARDTAGAALYLWEFTLSRPQRADLSGSLALLTAELGGVDRAEGIKANWATVAHRPGGHNLLVFQAGERGGAIVSRS